MAETRVAPPPLRTPMFDRTGVMTRPWQVWFGELFVRASAAADNAVLNAWKPDSPADPVLAVHQAIEELRERESGRLIQPIEDLARLDVAGDGQAGRAEVAVRDLSMLEALSRRGGWKPATDALELAAYASGDEMARHAAARPEHGLLANGGPDSRLERNLEDIQAMVAFGADARPHVPVMLLSGTHAERAKHPAGAYPDGTVYRETDRTLYYIAASGAWWYVSGVMTTATVSGKPTDLGVTDAGLLWHSADYRHTWRWTGSGWDYAPGDRRSGELAHFTEAPGAGWALCDGSSATRTYSDGTTGPVTLPNLIGSYIKGAAAYDPQVHAAVAGVFTGNPLPAHKHATPFVLTGTGRLVWKSWRWGGYSSEWLTGGYQVTGSTQNPNGEQLWWDAVSSDSAGTPSGTVSAGDVQHVHLMPYFRL